MGLEFILLRVIFNLALEDTGKHYSWSLALYVELYIYDKRNCIMRCVGRVKFIEDRCC